MIYNGMEVVTSLHMVDMVEDWSGVRSPARARRRLKRGFPQRIRTVAVPKKGAIAVGGRLIMHPEIWRVLRETIATTPTGADT